MSVEIGAYTVLVAGSRGDMVIQRNAGILEERIAVFSPEKPALYRYFLQIIWDHTRPIYVALMLNPSKADHLQNDPTVHRQCERARRAGCGGLIVLNAFAWRETDRLLMLKVDDPVGPRNDEIIRLVLRKAKEAGWPVLVGWGNEGGHRGRSDEVVALLREVGVQAGCVRYCANGQPGHPLYVGYDQELMPWPKPS